MSTALEFSVYTPVSGLPKDMYIANIRFRVSQQNFAFLLLFSHRKVENLNFANIRNNCIPLYFNSMYVVGLQKLYVIYCIQNINLKYCAYLNSNIQILYFGRFSVKVEIYFA